MTEFVSVLVLIFKGTFFGKILEHYTTAWRPIWNPRRLLQGNCREAAVEDVETKERGVLCIELNKLYDKITAAKPLWKTRSPPPHTHNLPTDLGWRYNFLGKRKKKTQTVGIYMDEWVVNLNEQQIKHTLMPLLYDVMNIAPRIIYSRLPPPPEKDDRFLVPN